MINVQLQEMIQKLESKLKGEVHQRIENQRNLNSHLHTVGNHLQETLLSKFDNEMSSIQDKMSDIEQTMAQWEPALLDQMSANR